MSEKHSYQYIKNFVEERGYQLVSTEYKNAHRNDNNEKFDLCQKANINLLLINEDNWKKNNQGCLKQVRSFIGA